MSDAVAIHLRFLRRIGGIARPNAEHAIDAADDATDRAADDDAAKRKARDSFSIVVNFDQSWLAVRWDNGCDNESRSCAIAIAPRLAVRCAILICLLGEGDCHIEPRLEGDYNVG